ncbi:MAG: primosomal protein N' [Flavobacteriales bacterium]|nr:MAG: primosomal protein N' [Flavobacteriales bacterium]
MNDRLTLFADVILPVPIHRSFTYRIPFELNNNVHVGCRVIVPFGKSKMQTAVVLRIHEDIPLTYQSKYIEAVLDSAPIVTDQQIKFWQWISRYYMSPIGDVMNAALPSHLKLASETKFEIHPEYNELYVNLNERETEIVDYLEHKEVCDLKELSDLVGLKTIQPVIKKLIEHRVLISREEIRRRYKPKTVLCYELKQTFQVEQNLNMLIEELELKKRNDKQIEGVMAFLHHKDENKAFLPIQKSYLLNKGISNSTLNTLSKKGVLKVERYQVDRINNEEKNNESFKSLSTSQENALKELNESMKTNDVTLLHGVTGSGKTEIYVQIIQDYLDQGHQVLFLLPEIALTTQLIQRLSVYFGEKIGVYHSKFNQNERVEIWNKVLADDPKEFRIILGARSSVFLPFQSLGLIIVDEEHEGSFKQYDPSPRYNARDASIVLGQMHQAKVILGTATPALETYYNAKQGKFGLVELKERYQGLKLPEVLFADVKRERRLKNMNSHFSNFLLETMDEVLKKKEQVILFQNRRGYTPLWSCEICNWTPKCNNCDVSLTYHKHANHLKCHYCGFTTNPVGSCPSCGSNRLNMIGFGTEKIEDELSLIFPDKVIKRLDLDTTRAKNAYEEILNDFDNGLIDILIGTQMVTKGLDFDNVYLVGILDADMLLNRPDFRAYERSYQLMSQVSGRAGRLQKQGKVIIQTGDPDHWVLELISGHNYNGFYDNEIIERKNFNYPPFYKLISLTVKHKNINLVELASKELAQKLRGTFKERVIGPEFPLIQKIKNQYLKEIKLKIERTASEKKVKEKLHEIIDKFYQRADFKTIRIVIDVDPL